MKPLLIDQKKIKKSTGIWLWGIGVALLPLWVLWKNIFPTQFYYFDRNVGNGLRIVEKKIAGQRFVFIPSERDGLIGELKLSADFRFPNGKTSNLGKTLVGQLQLAKNYEVVLYPKGERIVSVEELKKIVFWQNETFVPNGALLSDERAVYVVSNGQKCPFISPEVFERLGYDWKKISSLEIPPELSLGTSLNLQTAHPEGTFFRTADNQFFIFFQGQKRPVAEELIRQVWPEFFWIELKEAEPNYLASCFSKKNFWGENNFSCRFDLKNEKAMANVFIAKIDGLDDWQIKDFRSRATTSFFLEPRRSLALFEKKTKDRIRIKYGFLRN